MNSLTNCLKFTVQYSYEKVVFLDVYVERLHNGLINTGVYRKPCHSNMLLHRTSMHPPHIFKNIIKGQSLRCSRLNPSVTGLEKDLSCLRNRLKNRGYKISEIEQYTTEALNSRDVRGKPYFGPVQDIIRTDIPSTLLNVKFATSYTTDLFEVKNIICKHWDILKADEEIFNIVVDLLDVSVTKLLDGTLSTSLCRKPFPKNSILHARTCHPLHMVNNIRVAQFQRVRRICSNASDYQRQASDLKYRFQARGYNKGLIEKAYDKVQTMDRGDLLKDKTKHTLGQFNKACIDENLDMVEFLVKHKANVNHADNEGWTPLHVAASCGYVEIAKFLLKSGANVAAVNSDGDVPLDIAEDDEMESILRAEVDRRGIDVDMAKREEEEVLVQDARQWLNSGKIADDVHPKTGATAVHVAAAKGYIEAMRLLLQAGYDVNVRDKDGWTPLHAAAHWGVKDACRLLVEHFCDMNALSNVGQTPFDVADEDMQSCLEELQKKQADLRSEKEANQKRALIDTGNEQQLINTNKHRRSSVCRMPSKEKISVQELSKERKTLETITLGEDESISSSDEDSKNSEESTAKPVVNDTGKLNGAVTVPPSSVSMPAAANQKFTGTSNQLPEQDISSPALWRAGLRKTGSFGAIQDAKLSENTKENGIKRSASSPRLDGEDKSKEPRLARVPPTPTRRMFSASEPDTQKGTGTSRTYQTPVRDEESESQRKARSRLMRQSRRSTQGVTLTDLKEAEKTVARTGESKSTTEQQNHIENQKEIEDKTTNSTELTGRSRLHCSEGVTSTRSVYAVNPVMVISQAEKDSEEVSKDENEQENRSFLSARDRRKGRKDRRPTGMVSKTDEGEENHEMEHLNHEETPGLGISERLISVTPSKTGLFNYQRHNSTSGVIVENDQDYKKLYENLQGENEKLKEQLQEIQLKLTQTKLELERATQRQERYADRPALLELERFERRALELKTAELEEELKVLSDLKADNQRLKDENAALIRVISKLSK
ncbi:protein phosphatase 1 regulatory subunit 12C [Protopterus annectens]|uniref:protein phosphatase 1 regulatory subunit 12C n=1 Tax=Protopterus annectens TaxID=7888 RepID=UPI001CF9D281|nr:protein phosphatase 1 regulatory subunit 12C [Protopterus annectens]